MNPSGQPSEVQPVTLASLDELRARQRRKSQLKGRKPDDLSMAQVQALLGPRPVSSRPTSGPMPSTRSVLITGRQFEHWHTGSMTCRASVLYAIEPMATASLCGADLQALNLISLYTTPAKFFPGKS